MTLTELYQLIDLAAGSVSRLTFPVAFPCWAAYMVEVLEGEARCHGIDGDRFVQDVVDQLQDRLSAGRWDLEG